MMKIFNTLTPLASIDGSPFSLSSMGILWITEQVAKNVIESTSSLLVAMALVNADNVTFQTYDLWQFFDGLFAVRSSGFIPRFLYPVKKETTNSTLYIANTRIPDW
jgi:hypothetical protein